MPGASAPRSPEHKPYLANRTLGVLSKLFNLAEVWGWRQDGSNPCRHVRRYREHQRERFLSEEETARLGEVLREAEEEMPSAVAAFRLLLLTGCWMSEIRDLKWENVKEDCIELHPSKTGGWVVPLGPEAQAVFSSIPCENDNPWVIAGKLPEPLEIAVGDRIRIGATQWEKQLFNGTVVTIEDLEVRRAEAAAVSRKARNGQAAGRRPEADMDRYEPEFSVHITACTDDGRRVIFRHDEIRDWHDNIRIDHGYAMTIASAQGLTVDRAFLLADDRPARETVYPAATRHREELDICVNRAPLALDIAEHRPEDEADMPVTDSDVRAYLAERWSRSQPKEAALDYVTDGAWRDANEGTQLRAQLGGRTVLETAAADPMEDNMAVPATGRRTRSRPKPPRTTTSA